MCAQKVILNLRGALQLRIWHVILNSVCTCMYVHAHVVGRVTVHVTLNMTLPCSVSLQHMLPRVSALLPIGRGVIRLVSRADRQ